jgi:long-chain acyl-CoA synthetase
VPRLFEKIYNLVMKSVQEGTESKRRIFNWALGIGKRFAAGERGLVAVQHAVADKLVFEKLRMRMGSRLRFFVSGGAALPPEIGAFFLAAGIRIMEGYGLTETSPVLSVNPPGDIRIGTVGKILNGVTVAIQRIEDGSIIAEVSGESYPTSLSSAEGEIIAKGPNIMKGYWGKDEATREVIDADGWFHTGDIGKFERGFLRITDRLKHMIVNAGGKNIYPGPIEDTLKTSLYIDQVVLLGEKKTFISALIVPDFEQLKNYARQNNLSTDEEDLVKAEQVLEIYRKELREFSKQLASHEKVRDFRLLTTPFTIETGELTPTLKVKRKVIEKKFAHLIDEIYSKDVD